MVWRGDLQRTDVLSCFSAFSSMASLQLFLLPSSLSRKLSVLVWWEAAPRGCPPLPICSLSSSPSTSLELYLLHSSQSGTLTMMSTH